MESFHNHVPVPSAGSEAPSDLANFNLTKAAYSVTELLGILPIGRTSLYAAIKDGRLKARKHGKKTLFLAADIAVFLGDLPALTEKRPSLSA